MSARDFMGRYFVFEGIRQALAGEEFSSAYVMIRGEPGIGKTAIAAMLVLITGAGDCRGSGDDGKVY
jgi:hypothetical protein